VTTFFIYDGDNCVQELGGDGVADLTFATGGSGIKHCISTRNGTLYYPNGGGSTALITGGTGATVERFDCEDAFRPVFLTSDGIIRQGATSSLIGFRWLQFGCAWCPENGFFDFTGGIFSPSLGQPVSAHKDKPKQSSTPTNRGWDLAMGKKV
jgi:hypothetical protein